MENEIRVSDHGPRFLYTLSEDGKAEPLRQVLVLSHFPRFAAGPSRKAESGWETKDYTSFKLETARMR